MKTEMLAAGLCLFCSASARGAGEAPRESRVLVVYYSHSGNTRAVAETIGRLTGGDLFEIEPLEAYPSDYRTLTEQAKKEIAAGHRPAIAPGPEEIDRYDIVAVGSPCWWGTVAPPVATFLAARGLAGRTVVPFMTHGGSGLGRSEADIRRLCPQATVAEGLAVRGTSADSCEAAVQQWLQRLGIGVAQ